MSKVVVTGGAGFIGSHIVDGLINEGHEVTVFDSLDPQVHPSGKVPGYLNPSANFVKGDVLDKGALWGVVKDAEYVFHEAAAVGVGQSMYKITHYMDVNTMGTANLLQLLVDNEHSVRKIIVASSMSIYGEGKYSCPDCGVVYPSLRPSSQMSNREWAVKCPKCKKGVEPVPTDESTPLEANSIYAIGKKTQEEMCLVVGKAYGIPAVALRYFNVYGSRQALSNPYTGVAAIFTSRIKNNNPPVVFEDGNQSRDFIHISDVVAANLLVMKKSEADYNAYNVGTGVPVSIKEVAESLVEHYGAGPAPEVTGEFRKGDVRCCFADIGRLNKLGFSRPRAFAEGMPDLVEWVNSLDASEISDGFDTAKAEMDKVGLIE